MKTAWLFLALASLTSVVLGQSAQPSHLSQSKPAMTREQLEVLNVEEQFRQARLRNDLKAFDRILADDYSGTNQNGNTRNKAETKELFKTFKLKSITVEKPQVIVHADTAVVTGHQTEVVPESAGPSHLRFVRVYVRQNGRWQLLTSQQTNAPADR